MSVQMRDIDEMQTRLQKLAPADWYMGPMSIVRELDPRPGYPAIRYEAEARCVRVAGKRPPYDSLRKAELRIVGESVESLEAAVRALPSLDTILAVPLGTDFTLYVSDD
jgi:hypothetical protein